MTVAVAMTVLANADSTYFMSVHGHGHAGTASLYCIHVGTHTSFTIIAAIEGVVMTEILVELVHVGVHINIHIHIDVHVHIHICVGANIIIRIESDFNTVR